MHPRISELEQYLKSADDTLLAAVQSLPPELRRERAAAAGWSAAEILEHLTYVERRFSQLLMQMITNARRNNGGPDPDTSSILAMIDVSVVLDRTRKVEALEAARPRRNLTAEDAWQELLQARRDLIAILHSADGVNLGSVHHEHPLFGPMSGYQWLVFLGAHELRHAAQIRELQQQLVPSH